MNATMHSAQKMNLSAVWDSLFCLRDLQVFELKQSPRFPGKFLLVKEDSRVFSSKILSKPFLLEKHFPIFSSTGYMRARQFLINITKMERSIFETFSLDKIRH